MRDSSRVAADHRPTGPDGGGLDGRQQPTKQVHAMDTLSGVSLDLDDPRPEDIVLADVAGGLAKVCRFGGQATRFYSVAQHALLVARFVTENLGRPDLVPWALHHDSAEAYTCDLPRPLKLKLRE